MGGLLCVLWAVSFSYLSPFLFFFCGLRLNVGDVLGVMGMVVDG